MGHWNLPPGHWPRMRTPRLMVNPPCTFLPNIPLVLSLIIYVSTSTTVLVLLLASFPWSLLYHSIRMLLPHSSNHAIQCTILLQCFNVIAWMKSHRRESCPRGDRYHMECHPVNSPVWSCYNITDNQWHPRARFYIDLCSSGVPRCSYDNTMNWLDILFVYAFS
jgi:hypothetical protein